MFDKEKVRNINSARGPDKESHLLYSPNIVLYKPKSRTQIFHDVKQYDTRFNDLIQQIYNENLSLEYLIEKDNQLLQSGYEGEQRAILGGRCMDAVVLQKVGADHLFKVVPQICIPMTVPVKFAILEAKKYHEIRNLFKQLDSFVSSPDKKVYNTEIDELRTKIQERLLILFRDNGSEIKNVIAKVLSVLNV